MKKILAMLWILCLICVIIAGCADGDNVQTESYLTAKPSPLSSIDADPDNAVLSPEDDNAVRRVIPAKSTETNGTDVDLTVLSSTMVYAEIYNMMTSPDDYVGKTVKMSGPYYSQYYEETEQYYHFVIIEDATACCQQGVEFVWSGEHNYPDDYPTDNTRIEVVGIFDSYEEFGNIYYHLVVDDVTIL